MLSPLDSAEGILVTAAIRDISVRKAAEQHLAQMEGRYRGLLEAAPDAMVVVNQSGEIVLLNVQAEKQFGYRRDELLGQQVTNIIPEGFAERLIADDLRSAADALAQQIGTGHRARSRSRKDGSEFPIEIMLSPLDSAEGILVTAAIRDISVRKAAEQHLAQMEGRYRGLLEAAPDAMVVVNQAGEIVLLNVQAEKQFGYRRDELLGQKVTNIIPEGFAERLIADDLRSAEDALAQQIGTGIELVGAPQGRQRVPDRDHAQPARERRGHPGHRRDPRHHAPRRPPRRTCWTEGGGAEPLERGAGPVRLHRLARPAGAAADGGELHPAAVPALQGQARRRRRRVHRVRGRRRQPHAAPDPGPAGLLARRHARARSSRDTSSEAALEQALLEPPRRDRGQRRDRDPRSAADASWPTRCS